MHDETSQPRWPLRLLFVGWGSILLTIGIAAWKNGVLWIPTFSHRFGRVRFIPALGLVVLGAILALVGVIPWGKPSRSKKRSR